MLQLIKAVIALPHNKQAVAKEPYPIIIPVPANLKEPAAKQFQAPDLRLHVPINQG